jgi:hypothetical protein
VKKDEKFRQWTLLKAEVFSVYGQNFDIRVGRAAFTYNFDLTLRGLH